MTLWQPSKTLEQRWLPPEQLTGFFLQEREHRLHIVRLRIRQRAGGESAHGDATVLREGAKKAVAKLAENAAHLPAGSAGNHARHPGIIGVLRENGGELAAVSDLRDALEKRALIMLRQRCELAPRRCG